jgi:hypothetical protein
VRNWNLGAADLKEQLYHGWPHTPIPPKGSGVMLVDGPGGITVGGGKPLAVASGRTVALPHHRVAGLFTPLPKR